MSDASPTPRTHPDAWLSFLLGLASLCLCLLALTGLPALLIGLRGLRAINRSDGALRGARLAVAGMVLGGLGTLATAGGVAAILILRGEETSRRVECMDHLRQIGLGLNKYADLHGRYPAATAPSKDLPPERRVGWTADVLPLMGERTAAEEYQQLAAQVARDKAWDVSPNLELSRARLRVFACPARLDATPGTTNYVGVAGLGLDAATLPRDNPDAGVFGYAQSARREEIAGGISFTFLVIETAQETGPWLAGGRPTVRGVPTDAEHYCGRGRPFGGLHFRVTNVLWVDGSVRPLSDATPPEVFRAHATIRREE